MGRVCEIEISRGYQGGLKNGFDRSIAGGIRSDSGARDG